MNNDILLTIAIPTFNRGNFLIRALNSILSQYDERIEVLVSDNASEDNTESIVAELKAKYSQLKYIRNEQNIGPDKNFLQCMALAKGEFILLLGDDDLIIEGSLNRLLCFLEQERNRCKLVFLNYTLFEGNYVDLQHCSKPFLSETHSFVTSEKSKFVETCKDRLTYMSSFLLRHDAFDTVINPEKYDDTSFMHTCIAYEATKDDDTVFGIYCDPFVAQDASIENTPFSTNPQVAFKVFGVRMEHVYCEIAPRFGYDQALMNRIYSDYICKAWRGLILKTKAYFSKEWKESYKLYVQPVLSRHKKAKRKLRLYVYCPSWIAKIVYKVVRPIYRKFK